MAILSADFHFHILVEPGHKVPHELLSVVLVVAAVLRILSGQGTLEVHRVDGVVCGAEVTGGDGERRGTVPELLH